MNACLTIALAFLPWNHFLPRPNTVSFIIQDGGISDYSSLAQQKMPALQAMIPWGKVCRFEK